MRISFAAIVMTAFLLSSCSPQERSQAPSQQMSRCLEELNSIPEVAALRKNRGKTEKENDRPFEGLELALTVNRMVTSQVSGDDVDDLCFAQDTRENFDKLVKALSDAKMPPTVDFIEGTSSDAALQSEWLKSGNLLGNYTYDRRKAKKGTAQEVIENIAQNDRLLDSYSNGNPGRRKYFRYPRLQAFEEAGDRSLIDAWLKKTGYVEVPFTIESPDRLFSQAYCGALQKGNSECVHLIKATYFSFLFDATLKALFDANSAAGRRDIKHILVIYANQLTCDTLAEILQWYRGLGARFISIDDALSDPFYASRLSY